MVKEKLFGLTQTRIRKIVKELELPAFAAQQITDWLYKKPITSIDNMSNLSKKARQMLNERFELGLTPHSKVQVSTDGTKKYLFPIKENSSNSAYIPGEERNTLCVSTQIGCKMGCLFCMTGKQGFQGQLTAGDILNQIRSLPEFDKLTNIVYMGMGEPLDNLQPVLDSIEIITSEWGFAWSPRRITVSSIGVIPAMKTFLEKCEANLAISLHSPFDEERQNLMPIQNVFPLDLVLSELRRWDFGKQRKLSFEYIMFKGVNDSPKHAKELLRILNGIKCRVNLIRYHTTPGTPLDGSDTKTIENFQNILKDRGLIATLRASRGLDIFAACGLLSTKQLNKKPEVSDF